MPAWQAGRRRCRALTPMGLDKPVNAELAAAAGAAVVIDAADQAGDAVGRVLADQEGARAAAKVAAEIAPESHQWCGDPSP